MPHILKVEVESGLVIDGLHILANLRSANPARLRQHSDFKSFIESRIPIYELVSPGAIYHDFPNLSGFTGVVLLTESHLSVHTWPDSGLITFDLFVSNYMRNNRQRTRDLYEEVKVFFEVTEVTEEFVNR